MSKRRRWRPSGSARKDKNSGPAFYGPGHDRKYAREWALRALELLGYTVKVKKGTTEIVDPATGEQIASNPTDAQLQALLRQAADKNEPEE